MSDDFQADALREREEWLGAMGAHPDMVHQDRKSGLEFIFIRVEDGEALTRVWLPFSIQHATVYDSKLISVKKTQ